MTPKTPTISEDVEAVSKALSKIGEHFRTAGDRILKCAAEAVAHIDRSKIKMVTKETSDGFVCEVTSDATLTKIKKYSITTTIATMLMGDDNPHLLAEKLPPLEIAKYLWCDKLSCSEEGSITVINTNANDEVESDYAILGDGDGFISVRMEYPLGEVHITRQHKSDPEIIEGFIRTMCDKHMDIASYQVTHTRAGLDYL